ncbi:MAG: Hsp20/alpha crystallin family protein, partial [Deltaproteobacteria bacterium]|nr:Hsp20/alpha crystallin family protein [Deltaproteobacteria bacterium]
WYPTVESFVKEGNLVVRCEVPGMDPKDIDISIVGNTLTIKGERKASKEAKREDYLLSEVHYGSFERTLTLPEGVRADNIRANYKNGILEVTMPAEKAALPRKVTVEVEGAREELKKAV